MSREARFFKDKVVYWQATGQDRYGNRTIGIASEKTVRWESTISQMLDENNNPIQTEAMVWTDFDVSVGDVFWLGELANLPDPVTELKKVVGFEKTPNVTGRRYERVAMLAKYSDTIPDTTA